MKQEDKELLLKDLCARLPYGVKAKYYGSEEECECYDTIEGIYPMDDEIVIGQYGLSVSEIKPYLFPLLSMTEEDRIKIGNEFAYGQPHKAIDIFHKNHIDYRGLIPLGIALDATGLNIY